MRKQWTVVRVLNLLIGTFAIGDFFVNRTDYAVLLLGIGLLAMGVFNLQLGCGPNQSCELPQTKAERLKP